MVKGYLAALLRAIILAIGLVIWFVLQTVTKLLSLATAIVFIGLAYVYSAIAVRLNGFLKGRYWRG